MILEDLKQNGLEIGSMLGKEKGLKSQWTTDLWPMISMWEGSRGNYLRRTLLMIKKKRSLFIYIYQPQPKTIIDVLYLKDLSL